MLATTADQAFSDSSWWYEIKWDGYRCQIHLTDALRVFSRRGHDLLAWFPEIATIENFLPRPIVLDAEIVAWYNGRPSYQRLHERRGPFLVIVFDCLYSAGGWHLHETFWDRRQRLVDLVVPAPNVVVTDGLMSDGLSLLQAAQSQNLEGVMAKRLDSVYVPGRRVRSWQKFLILSVDWFEAVAASRSPHDGTWRWSLAQWRNGVRVSVGRISAPKGWVPSSQVGDFVVLQPPVSVEVAYREMTSEGKLRHASIRQWHLAESDYLHSPPQ